MRSRAAILAVSHKLWYPFEKACLRTGLFYSHLS